MGEPDVLDAIRELVARGFPVFAKEYGTYLDDLIRTSYFSARALAPNANVIFPHDVRSETGTLTIGWLVDDDPFTLGDSIPSWIGTRYSPPSDANNEIGRMDMWKGEYVLGELREKSLPPEIVVSRWEFMRRCIPRELLVPPDEGFDPERWYACFRDDYMLLSP